MTQANAVRTATAWEIKAHFHSHPEAATAPTSEQALVIAEDFDLRGARRVVIFAPDGTPFSIQKLRRNYQAAE